ncbi:MAG: hypothetical protein AB8H03_28040 [Saprospiraceae bacterium]
MEIAEKESLLNNISVANIKEVIQELLKLDLDDNRKQEIRSIQHRYVRLKKQKRLGILSFENENLTENQIVHSLIELINYPANQPFPKEKSISEKSKPQPILWKYISLVALVVGMLGSIAEILNYINIIPQSSSEKRLNIFVKDINGNVVLENEGELNIPIGNRSLNSIIGNNGKTNFSDITSNNINDTILIGLNAKGWEIKDNKNIFVFTGAPITLIVERSKYLKQIKGIIKNRRGDKLLTNAHVLIDNEYATSTDSLGKFYFELNEDQVKERHLLRIEKEGYNVKNTDYFPRKTAQEYRLNELKK